VTRELARFYKQQFDEFRLDLIESWGVHELSLKPVQSNLVSVYRQYLGLACLTTILSQRAPRNDYVRAVPEVSYLSMILAVKGLENSASVLLRQSIELALKHVFFSSHPVEFDWSLRRPGYREISFQFLLDYLRKTEE